MTKVYLIKYMNQSQRTFKLSKKFDIPFVIQLFLIYFFLYEGFKLIYLTVQILGNVLATHPIIPASHSENMLTAMYFDVIVSPVYLLQCHSVFPHHDFYLTAPTTGSPSPSQRHVGREGLMLEQLIFVTVEFFRTMGRLQLWGVNNCNFPLCGQ